MHQEPVMPHMPESKVIEGENARKQEVHELVEVICQKMEASESMVELKPLFADAFKLTRGMKLQQNVQAIYSERKKKLEGATS